MLFLLYISFHSHLLDAVLAKVKSYFRNQLDVVQEWEEFVASAPAGDCVQEYCRSQSSANAGHRRVCGTFMKKYMY